MPVEQIKVEMVSFNATFYREQIAAGLLDEEKFVENGLREQLYQQYLYEDRRKLLKLAYLYLTKSKTPAL